MYSLSIVIASCCHYAKNGSYTLNVKIRTQTQHIRQHVPFHIIPCKQTTFALFLRNVTMALKLKHTYKRLELKDGKSIADNKVAAVRRL
jgi:hypothetical protein